jgi:hypothetical protein
MFRVLNKSNLLLVIIVSVIINSICFADGGTTQTTQSTTSSVASMQKPGDYYPNSSLPTPNPAIFPPPPPKSPYLPTQPFTPTTTNPFMPSKEEAQKLLSGYKNQSLPTPNPDIFPPPPPPQPAAVNSADASTTTAQSNTTTETSQNSPAGGTQAQGSGGSTTTGTTASNAGNAQGGTAAPNTSNTSQGGTGTAPNSNSPTAQDTKVSNNLTDLQKCVPGTYAFPSPVKPITNSSYYGGTTSNPPPLMTYSVSGMQNGKCIVSITQSAVVPPTTIQNGVQTQNPATSPMANISKCNLSPSDMTNMVNQAQKNQMGGFYGTNTPGSNYYTKQNMTDSCSSYLVVNGAAIPYNSYNSAP